MGGRALRLPGVDLTPAGILPTVEHHCESFPFCAWQAIQFCKEGFGFDSRDLT